MQDVVVGAQRRTRNGHDPILPEHCSKAGHFAITTNGQTQVQQGHVQQTSLGGRELGGGQINHHIPSATHPAPPFKVFRWLRTSGLAPCQEVGTVFAADGELNEYTIVQLGGPLLLLPLPPPWRFRIACT